MIYAAANYILIKTYSDHFTPTTQVSLMQTKQFLDYNLQFHKKKQKSIVIEHKNIKNKRDFQEYFEKYKGIDIEKKIIDKNI